MPVSSVKTSKKSAFSCDQCRKRKVKCGGEKPHCVRCTRRHEICEYKLSPTLSYTQKLENRIKELEDALSAAQANGPMSITAEQSPLSTSTAPALPHMPAKRTHVESIEGLAVDEKGSVSYHGATSFFQLPTPYLNEALDTQNEGTSETLDKGIRRKEKLVNNAWQQRALEWFSETPVRQITLFNSALC